MKRSVAAILLAILCAVGCSRKADLKSTDDDADIIEPVKAAFAGEDIGKPLDWQSLGETDKAFLTALMDRDAASAKAALAAGAKAGMDCGHGCSALMLAAATGDPELVAAVKSGGGVETRDAEPYMEILKFATNAENPDYKAAVAEIAQLAGKQPAQAERLGTFTLEIDAKETAAFLAKHHARLLDKGCYVFVHDNSFGIGDKPDLLWILPTRNKFAVMAFTGVNGINYNIENHLVIRWMKKLDQDHPFWLTGCGPDFMSGLFAGKVTDPEALAARMYAFCPDVVDQGAGSVEALAKELKKTNELFFWWD